MHPVLDGQQAAGLGGKATVPRHLEEGGVDQLLEEGVGLDDAVEGVVLDRRQLLVVADQRQGRTQAERRQRLVGPCLVGLVEDDHVEVHVGDPRGGRRRAGGEVAVGLHQPRVVLVVAAEALHRGMDALGPGHPHRPHPGGAGEPLQRVVDRQVGVGGDQDPLLGVGRQPALHRLDDDRGLAGPRRPLDEHRLAGLEPGEEGDGTVLGWVGLHPLGEPAAPPPGWRCRRVSAPCRRRPAAGRAGPLRSRGSRSRPAPTAWPGRAPG